MACDVRGWWGRPDPAAAAILSAMPPHALACWLGACLGAGAACVGRSAAGALAAAVQADLGPRLAADLLAVDLAVGAERGLGLEALGLAVEGLRRLLPLLASKEEGVLLWPWYGGGGGGVEPMGGGSGQGGHLHVGGWDWGGVLLVFQGLAVHLQGTLACQVPALQHAAGPMQLHMSGLQDCEGRCRQGKPVCIHAHSRLPSMLLSSRGALPGW